MKSKERILFDIGINDPATYEEFLKWVDETGHNDVEVELTFGEALKAMQEYADQFAIGFKKWTEGNEADLMPISNIQLLEQYKQFLNNHP